MDDLTSRIAWAIAKIPEDRDLDWEITDVALAKILGTDKNTLARYRKQKGGLLKGDVIDRLISHYKFDPNWLFKGQGEPFPGARRNYSAVCGPEAPVVDFDDEFTLIPLMDGRISAGRGLLPNNIASVKVAFHKGWIKRKGSKPENLSLIKVDGDSMDPTLLSGDLVLVDHGRDYVASQGGIYAISIDGEIMIKRVQAIRPQGKLRVISDNKQYPPLEYEANEIIINGKVIWFARELER